MKRIVRLCHGFSWLLFSVISQAAIIDDVRIVIDVSGSMLDSDPQNLRVPALRMLNGMIPSGARAGVWTFGRYTNMEVKWGLVDDQWRRLADQGAAKIHSRGQFTDIERALQRATRGWEKADPSSRRNLILLTDGKVDISPDAGKNESSRNTILNQLIPRFIKNGVTIHSIALSDQTDESLLKQIARDTSGSYEIAASAEDLQRIFLRMFERATRPDTVPLEDNRFMIDKSVREMTLLVFRKSDQVTRLIGPGKQAHSELKHGAHVNWRNDQGYDLITVTSPSSGQWSLEADMDPDNRVMIVTDLKLVVDELPAFSTPDKALVIRLELHDQNQKISKNSFLKFVDFSLTHAAPENRQTLPLHLKKSRDIEDKGVYRQQLAGPLSEGKHELVVQADARTFSRSKRFTVEVQWPVRVDIENTRQPGIFQLNIQPREEQIKAESLQLQVSLKQPDGIQQELELTKNIDQWSAEVRANRQDGLHQLLIDISAQTLDGRAISHQLTPYPLLGVRQASEPEPVAASQGGDHAGAEIDASLQAQDGSPQQDSPADWMQTLIIVAVFNMLLILAAAGIYLVMRKNSRVEEVDLLEVKQDAVSEV